MSKFDYHRHLDEISQADCAYVQNKDRHYDASWKEDSGPGAYFTMKRPIDRFIAIAKRNQYDIFRVIKAEGLEGPDGSLIACVRDARRYLLLLEAELTEQLRNKLERPLPTEQNTQATGFRASDEQIPVLKMQPMPEIGTVVGFDRATGHVEILPHGQSLQDCYPPGTPEDGGQHSRHTADCACPVTEEHSSSWPWVVGHLNKDQIRSQNIAIDIWRRMAPGVFVLEPRLEPDLAKQLGPDICQLYTPVWVMHREEQPTSYIDGPTDDDAPPVAYWLRVDKAPPTERDRWRRLPLEQNLDEINDLGEYAELYSWDNPKLRYMLRRKEWLLEP